MKIMKYIDNPYYMYGTYIIAMGLHRPEILWAMVDIAIGSILVIIQFIRIETGINDLFDND